MISAKRSNDGKCPSLVVVNLASGGQDDIYGMASELKHQVLAGGVQ